MSTITVNGKSYDVDVASDTPLLWVIRDVIGLTGTKFGCGAGLCGCCTVHLDGVATRSCQVPMAAAAGKHVTTIEGLGERGLSPVQQAWVEHQVPQCGYCQSGQIMAAAGFLSQNPQPSADDITSGITNICRCGTYDRIKSAILTASGAKGGKQ